MQGCLYTSLAAEHAPILCLYSAMSFSESRVNCHLNTEVLLQIQDDDNSTIAENPDLGLKRKDKIDDHSFPTDKPSSEGTNLSNTSDSHDVRAVFSSSSYGWRFYSMFPSWSTSTHLVSGWVWWSWKLGGFTGLISYSTSAGTQVCLLFISYMLLYWRLQPEAFCLPLHSGLIMPFQ